MATITDPITFCSCSSWPRIHVSSITSSPEISAKLRCLPQFNGLRMQSPLRSSFNSLCLKTSRVSRRRTAIFCEAQDTAAIDIPSVTDTTWQSLVLKAVGPVLVEFWAPWCGPCRVIHPVIGELAVQYSGKLKCYKLNTDDSPSITTQYGIRSIPTIMIFKNGEKKDAVIGAVPKTTLTASIEKFL